MHTQLAIVALFFSLHALATGAKEHNERAAIDRLLDDFHHAAAVGDSERYLGYFSPQAVFLGTDDWERWPLDDFRRYVAKRFVDGEGWVYQARERHVMFSPQGDTAWFDEIAESTRWGRFRGTGVLLRLGDEWRLAHYSLTLLVPNDRFEQIADTALEGFRSRTFDSRTIDSRTIDSRTMDLPTIDSRTIDSRTIDSRAMDLPTTEKEAGR